MRPGGDMINEELTYKKFGYYSYNWGPHSAKRVVVNCDQCNQIREVIKGKSSGLCYSCNAKNRKLSEETKNKISLSKIGKKKSVATIQKMILAKLGKPNLKARGQKRTEETRQKMSVSSAWKGKRGEGTSNWKGGLSPLRVLIYNSPEHKQWRRNVFEKNHYTCQECGVIGGHLEAHHIRPFYKIFQEFLQTYSQFSPIEDKETLVRLATTYQPFWNENNGQTLCEKCHKLETQKIWLQI